MNVLRNSAMESRQPGNIVTHIGVALFAGVFASLVTLMASERLRVPPLAEKPEKPDESRQIELASSTGSHDTNSLPDTSSSANDLSMLEISLDEASAERSQMAATLITLTRQIDELEAELVNLDARSVLEQGISTLDGDALVAPPSHSEPGFNRGLAGFGEQGGSQVSLDNLLAAGLDEQSARDLQSRRDQFQLARLELFDQAAREGWADTDQLSERLEELDGNRVDLREELGDAAYDQYLYASGSSNRVSIESIINGSAADLAGLLPGDILDTYANERIFRAQELQQATRSGTRGAFVQLVFSRNGQSMSNDIPRGPMGVTLGAARIEP